MQHLYLEDWEYGVTCLEANGRQLDLVLQGMNLSIHIPFTELGAKIVADDLTCSEEEMEKRNEERVKQNADG